MAAVVGGSKLLMSGLGTTKITNSQHIHAALHRPQGQALITVSNHTSALDDPLVLSMLLPDELVSPLHVRWTLCATDRCFKNAAFTAFFRAGKVGVILSRCCLPS